MNVTSRYTTSRYITSRYTTSRYTTSRYTTSRYTATCCVSFPGLLAQFLTSAAQPQHAKPLPPASVRVGCRSYRIIGSHSGVKLCRWTKSMLRGRGGCYKHT